MTHPDFSEEANDWRVARAKELIKAGKSVDEAVEIAVDMWEKSLLRVQLINIWQKQLLNNNKPTLHVSLFEAAKLKKL